MGESKAAIGQMTDKRDESGQNADREPWPSDESLAIARQLIADVEREPRYSRKDRMVGAGLDAAERRGELKAARECAAIAQSHVAIGEFVHGGRHDCEQAIADEIRARYPEVE